MFYVVFRLPGYTGAQGPGAGPGFQCEAVERESSVFVGAEGEAWARLAPERRLVIDPVYADAAGKAAAGAGRPKLMLFEPTASSPEGVATAEAKPDLPKRTEMLAPYPNPFNPQVTIAYALKEPAEVTIAVYDVRGRKVYEVRPGLQPAGHHAETWAGQDMRGRRQASGTYFIRLRAGNYEETRRVALVK